MLRIFSKAIGACSSVDGVGESMPWAEPSANEVGSPQISVLNSVIEKDNSNVDFIVLVGPLQRTSRSS